MGTGQLLTVCPAECQNQKLEKQAAMTPKQSVGVYLVIHWPKEGDWRAGELGTELGLRSQECLGLIPDSVLTSGE